MERGQKRKERGEMEEVEKKRKREGEEGSKDKIIHIRSPSLNQSATSSSRYTLESTEAGFKVILPCL